MPRVVFAYYKRLSQRQKRIYRASDEIPAIVLPARLGCRSLILALADALEDTERRRVEAICQDLSRALTDALGVAPVRVNVLARRPSESWGELHGLYTRRQGRAGARITVWMRTARRRQVVAFRTFLRTLLHEICHHLDYELLHLEDSLHTDGFYRRESSLMLQLAGPGRRRAASRMTGRRARSAPTT